MDSQDVTLPLRSTDEARTLLGPLDSNARLVRELHGVNVLVRDGGLRLLGAGPAVAIVREVFGDCLELIRQGRTLGTTDLARRLRLAAGAEEQPVVAGGRVPEGGLRRAVKARTPGQKVYLEALRSKDVVFVTGPAGTGKTYLAVAAAVEAVRAGTVRRIVLVRPAVEAGEKLGFLPGDYQAKVDPYLRPLHDALRDLLDDRTSTRYLESEIVEVCPLAYMRGRTLNDAYVILDEAQNTTVQQMMMFLTRMGEGSLMVVTGDPTQVDLPAQVTSGLEDAVRRLEGGDGIDVVRLGADDVVRHPVVQRIIDAYGDTSARRARRKRSAR